MKSLLLFSLLSLISVHAYADDCYVSVHAQCGNPANSTRKNYFFFVANITEDSCDNISADIPLPAEKFIQDYFDVSQVCYAGVLENYTESDTVSGVSLDEARDQNRQNVENCENASYTGSCNTRDNIDTPADLDKYID